MRFWRSWWRGGELKPGVTMIPGPTYWTREEIERVARAMVDEPGRVQWDLALQTIAHALDLLLLETRR